MPKTEVFSVPDFEAAMSSMGLAHEVRWVLAEAHALGKGSDYLKDVFERRSRGEPLAYIFGHWSFRDLELHVGPGVLIPRPETEELVDLVLERMRSKERSFPEWRIVDAGAGSGCLGIAIDKEARQQLRLKTHLCLIEASSEARPWLQENVSQWAPHAEVFGGSWMTWAPSDLVQVFVSNPPYISGKDGDRADADVAQWEPPQALYPADLGRHPDATGPYRELIKIADLCVAKGGIAAFELGSSQAAWIGDYVVQNYPLWRGTLLRDMAGKERFWVMERIG